MFFSSTVKVFSIFLIVFPFTSLQIEGAKRLKLTTHTSEQSDSLYLLHFEAIRKISDKEMEKRRGTGTSKYFLGLIGKSFPDELLPRFGVVQEIRKAKQFASGGRDRYFMQDERVIKLKDKKIVVCNQWTSENIKPFLTAARKLGFDIR